MNDPMLQPCVEWEEKLAAIDDLSSTERNALDEHVASCQGCAAVLADYREMDSLIRNSLTPDRPLELWGDSAVKEKPKVAEKQQTDLISSANNASVFLQAQRTLVQAQKKYVFSEGDPEGKNTVHSKESVADSSLEKGRLLLDNVTIGNYRLIRTVGKGNQATVYLGEHIHSRTLAAVKMLHTWFSGEEIERFRREARTLEHLVHPNVVRVLNYGIYDGIPFLVMDYAPHGSLRQRHPGGVPVPPSTVVSYVKQVANALQYLHDKRLIHQDVKPENMLLGAKNQVVLSDFSMALPELNLTHFTLSGIGTCSYMAPEQIEGKTCLASDQYSLGVVVYEWFCGERPFHGSLIDVAIKHRVVPPPSLRRKVSDLPRAVEYVVLKALAKDPERRFASVQEFADALERAFTYPGISSVAVSDKLPMSNQQPAVLSQQSATRRKIILQSLSLGGLALVVGASSYLGLHHLHTPKSSLLLDETMSPSSQVDETMSPSSLGTVLSIYRGHSKAVDTVAWSPDGKYVVSGSSDRSVQVWDASNGVDLYSYHDHLDVVRAVTWSPNGKRIASGSYDNTVRVWSVFTGANTLIYKDYFDWVQAVAWSPNGEHIASGVKDGTVRICEATTGNSVFVYHGHSAAVTSVAWSPDGTYIASASSDKTVRVWDANTGSTILVYNRHVDGVDSVAWMPDGRCIASGSNDGTVQVWAASTGRNILVYRGHTAGVRSVAWSPDGTRIVSGSDDTTVQVWNSSTGDTVLAYHRHTVAVNAVAWSPDGRYIASASDDKTVHVWSTE